MGDPQPPTLEEFIACCDAECQFLVRELGFERLPEPLEYNCFSVQFRKGDIRVVLYGENWGQTASCDLVRHEERVYLGLLVPAPERATKRRKGSRPGQLEQVRMLAARLRQHASDFLQGDYRRFDAALAEWKRITTPRPVTEAHRHERELQTAVTEAGHASKRGNYADVVRLLEPYIDKLSAHQRRMLEEARERLKDV